MSSKIAARARILALLLLAVCAPALADGRDAVMASMQKFLAASSWHATMQLQGAHAMTNEMDFEAPDRYRIQIDGMGTQYIIGNTMIMDMGGHSMRLPMPKGTLSKYRDPGQLQENYASITVDALGSDSVGGTPAHKYRIHNAKHPDSDVTMWIGGNDYPLQIQVVSESGTVTITYSHFNDPAIKVQAP